MLVGDDGKTLLGVLYTLRLRDIATAHAPNGFQRIEDAFDPKGPIWVRYFAFCAFLFSCH